MWNTYDWSGEGEEWTQDTQNPRQWKLALLNRIMYRYIKPNSIIVEIGCGAGRWSVYLQQIAKRLILVDIASNCIELCRKRFRDKTNIEYYLNDGRLDFLSSDSVDYIWSYDVFVHINPSDVKQYIENIGRVLKSGGIAIIHHPSEEYGVKEELTAFRAKMTADKFAEFVKSNGMDIIEQNQSLPHKKGDIISIFSKPSRS